MKNLPKNQAAFTLIELIVVIVILAILAAFTIPRFRKLDNETHLAQLEALASSLRSAAVLAHSTQIANNLNLNDPITMEGHVVEMKNGYPAATIKGISETQSPSQPASFSVSITTDNTVIFTLDETPPPHTNCYITYTPAQTSTPPSITITSTGCS
jgi:MSHA pilin protein MshA